MIWQSRSTTRLWQMAPNLKLVSKITGLSRASLSRMRAMGLDILDADAMAERYATRRRGRRPRADAPIVAATADVVEALRKIRDAATPPTQA